MEVEGQLCVGVHSKLRRQGEENEIIQQTKTMTVTPSVSDDLARCEWSERDGVSGGPTLNT